MSAFGTNGLNRIVSDNLRKIREDFGLSQEKLAELTGVSRSMINQIERGASSPTLATVYKITSALKVSLSELTARPQQPVELLNIEDVEPLKEENGSFRAYLLQPFNDGNNLEIFYCGQDARSSRKAEAHQPGTEEYLTLCKGRLSIAVNEQKYDLRPGGFISFKADSPHEYINESDEEAAFSLVLFYRNRRRL